MIGSGMAGLATARILKDAGHNITIFEALPGRGMDSHSIEFEGGLIDAPLRVMNSAFMEKHPEPCNTSRHKNLSSAYLYGV